MKKRRPLTKHRPKVGCPFCFEWLPEPEQLGNVFSSDGVGGSCSCGAYFIVDEIGKAGGQALLDVQALACNGDLERAITLREGPDFELKTKPYQTAQDDRLGGRIRGQQHLLPKIWALKLREKYSTTPLK